MKVGFCGRILVAIALLGQIGGLVHVATTRHVECAEHGDLVEVAAVSEKAPCQHSEAAFHQTDKSGEEHEHCLFARFRRDGVSTSLEAAPVAGWAAAQDLQYLAPHVEPLRSIALLRYAPKSSPPA